MAKKTKVVDQLTKGVEGLFKKYKVEYIKGLGKFQDSKTLLIEQLDGSTKVLKSKNYIIATGSEPNNLPGGVLPIDENRVLSSTGALALKEIPKKLVVVGGGVIGLELGSVYQRLGAHVEVVEYAEKILTAFDYEIGNEFLKILKKQKIHFHLSTKVVGGSVNDESVKITIEDVKVNF